MNKNLKNSLLATAIIAALGLSACNNNNDVATETKTTIASLSTEAEKTANAKQQLTSLYKQAKQTLFKQRALSATMFGLSQQDVGEAVSSKMELYSPENEQKLRAELLSISNQIASIKLDDADITTKNNQQVMSGLARYFAGEPNFTIGFTDTWMGLSPFIVNQINGPLIDIPRIMQNDQPITTEQEALDYIARLAQFDKLATSIIEKQTADAAQNWIPSKVTLQGAIKYLKGFTRVAAEKHPFVSVFREKVEKIESLSFEQKQTLISQVIAEVSQVVYPAYQSVEKASEQLLVKARPESGIWAQPKGSAYYQDAIKQLGDSELTPSQIHQVGLDEVARISNAMDKILLEQGYKKGTVGERMVALNEEPRFLYEDSTEGREELLRDINGYITDVTEKMTPVFKTTPSYQVEVKAFQLAADRMSQRKAQEEYNKLGQKNQALTQQFQKDQAILQQGFNKEMDSVVNRMRDFVEDYGKKN